MKRKPGTLTLATARSHETQHTSSTPLWWEKSNSWNGGGGDVDNDDDDDDDSDNSDDDGKRKASFIVIRERDKATTTDHRGTDAEPDEPARHDLFLRDHRGPRGHPDRDEPDRRRYGHADLVFGHSRDPATMASWAGQPSVKGATETTRMILLTSASMGIAFTWGVEMTYCTPYLLSLGLTKGQASIVWLAGPLSGLLVQPVVGIVSDQCTSKWGRRRPFMAVGSVIVAAGLLTLGYTREIVAFLTGSGSPGTQGALSSAARASLDHGGSGGGSGGAAAAAAAAALMAPPHRKLVICVAVLALYVTDFAINAVMSCNRSLLVDSLPLEKQQEGAAWASRMASFGHLVGYAAGAVDLVALLGPALGDTQFKKLSGVAALSILVTCTVTCWAVTERVLLQSALRSSSGSGSGSGRAGGDGWVARLTKIFRQIWATLLTLPPRIQAICWAVFWGWIGWFPFIVYSSTWVGETYFRYDVPADARGSTDAVGDMGRIGSYALTAYSLMTVLASGVLPLLVRSPYNDTFTRRPPASLARLVAHIDKTRPDLLTVWTCGHVLFACSMFLAPFARSFRFATVLVTLCGIPYTVVTWAPAAFLGVEVNKLTAGAGAGAAADDGRQDGSKKHDGAVSPAQLEKGHHHHHHKSKSSTEGLSTGELSGIYFGILNIYTTLPQLLGNLISAVVFAVLEPGKSPELAKDAHPSEHHSTDGPNAIAVTLFLGAVFALVAAASTRKLARL